MFTTNQPNQLNSATEDKAKKENEEIKKHNLPLALKDYYQIPQKETVSFTNDYQWSWRRVLKNLFVPFIGWFGVATRNHLVEKGKIGLVLNNGKPEFLKSGWHMIIDPYIH